MSARSNSLARLAFAAVVAMLAVGCIKWPKPIPDVGPMRKERLKQAEQSVRTDRDEIEFRAALSYDRQGDKIAARKILEAIANRNSPHREARIMLVEMLLTNGDPQGAVDRGVVVAEYLPEDPEIWQLLSAAFEELGNTAAAEDCMAEALAVSNEVSSASVADDGKPALASKNTSNADESQAQALKQPASDVPTFAEHDPSAALMMAEISLACGDRISARRYAKEALAAAPQDPSAKEMASRTGTVTVAESVAEAPRKPAPREATPATFVEPAQTSHHALSADLERRGTAALAAGAPDAANDYFARAISRHPDDDSLALRVAVLALRHDQPELAVRLAETGLQHTPNSAALYRTLGTAQYRLGEWHAAQAALRQALSLDNTNPLSYFLMGCTLTQLGDEQAADWHYRQARQRDPKYAQR